jgi:hypothetical protein
MILADSQEGALADPVATTLSTLALAVSCVTAWFTFFRRGTVKLTQPTVIIFGPDGGLPGRAPNPKVFLRTLLVATSKRGRVNESMHVTLTRNETRQNFNIWVYGDEKLVRGSGLFVGETGVAANHHFLLPSDGASFAFVAGIYRLELFAKLLGDTSTLKLLSQTLEVDQHSANALREPGTGLYFDWGPDSERYIPHVDKRPPKPPHELLLTKDSIERDSD